MEYTGSPQFRNRLRQTIACLFIVSLYTLAIVIASVLNQYIYKIMPELSFWFIPVMAAVVIAAISIYVWDRLKEMDMLRYEFITIAAHKFRTPLTHIKWVSEELEKTESDPDRKESLILMQESNQHLIEFTDMIIQAADADLMSKSLHNPETLMVSEIFELVISSVSSAYQKKNIKLIRQIDPVLVVKADRERIKFTFQTLIENAHAYTPEGGSVTISATRDGTRAHISISDTGIGIRPDDLHKIFSKFYRTSNAMYADTEGFGIGLYLVKSIIKRHKGSIEIYSAGEGKGTTFTVILPLDKHVISKR